MDADVGVIGAGVVGSAVALALARRGAEVALLEAEPEPALAASGTNSGILHTGFDSKPGEVETQLILRSAELREPLLEELGVPVVPCGALLRPQDDSQRDAVVALAANAERNGVAAVLREDGALEVPGESLTDPIAFTRALARAAERHGARVHTDFRVAAIVTRTEGLRLRGADGERLTCRLALNCAGLFADEVARLVGDDSFAVYPRKGEFLVFDGSLEHILLPVPREGTKGVLVFPTLDGKIVAGPTAIDGEDKNDWFVRARAREELLPQATAMLPELEDAEPVAAYAGLRPAGRGVNYLIGPSPACSALVNVAAIRSTGLSASLGIAERVVRIVEELGLRLGSEEPLSRAPRPSAPGSPWWREVAEHRTG